MDNYGNIIQQPNMEYANAMYAQAENVAPLNHPGVIMVQHDGIPVMPPMQVPYDTNHVPMHNIEHSEIPVLNGPEDIEQSPNLAEDIPDHIPVLASAENDNNINQSVTSEQIALQNENPSTDEPKLDSSLEIPVPMDENASVEQDETPAAAGNDGEASTVVDGEASTVVDGEASTVVDGEAATEASVEETAAEEPVADTTESPRKKEEEIDPNQCRICLVKKDLIDIFMIEERLSFSDKILVLCPNIKIYKNDYLPHFICETCLTSLKVAYNFKLLCEQTDKELRSKLKRGKKKAKGRTTDFVFIGGGLSESEKSDDDKKGDDDEFHISGSLSEADSSESSDSSYTTSKKKKAPARKRTRSRKKSTPAKDSTSSRTSNRKRSAKASSPPSSSRKRPGPKRKDEQVKKTRREIVLIKAIDTDDEEDDVPLNKRIKTITNVDISTIVGAPKKPSESGTKPHACPYCDKTFNSPKVLDDHKKTHANDRPYTCKSCTKQFKNRSAYSQHMNKHKDSDTGELKCSKKEPKQEIKKPPTGSTEKKKKPDIEPQTLGKDLFKCVAPLTSTYWSDSFSD